MLRTRLNEALKTAMRSRLPVALSTVRLILAAIKDRDIAARTQGKADGISDDEILDILQKMTRQRQEAIDLYERGGRVELAEQERQEIEFIRTFLPKPLSAAETEAAVQETVDDLGAVGLKDMGRVMTELRARYAGRMDFAKASAIAKARLG